MWGNALCRMLNLPSPALWKWKFVEGVWKVIWMSIDPLSKECRLTKNAVVPNHATATVAVIENGN